MKTNCFIFKFFTVSNHKTKIQDFLERISYSKFGNEGTSEREIFNADSFKYYFGEIVKSRRQELKITQEQLALKIGKKEPIYHVLKMEKIL